MAPSTNPLGQWEWRDLYVAALMEPERKKAASRIVEAEYAIITRARELFGAAGDHIHEQDAMDDALYALQALRNCLEQRESSSAAAA